jgi:hypothetical protein
VRRQLLRRGVLPAAPGGLQEERVDPRYIDDRKCTRRATDVAKWLLTWLNNAAACAPAGQRSRHAA